jgi:hypothetical protein
MTAEGGPLTRYRRAVASGSATVTLAAAHECPALDVDDAFAVLLALADGSEADRDRYERAVARWLARAGRELRPPPDASELQLLLAALRALPSARDGPGVATGRAAAETLASLFAARGLSRARQALAGWVDRRA